MRYEKFEPVKPGLMPHIPALYAFLAVDKDGDEGLCAFNVSGDMWMAMVAADERRLDLLKDIARKMIEAGSSKIRLVRFTERVDLETFEPD